MIYLIPNGTKNIADIFPDVNFSLVDEYYLQVLDEDEEVVATTAINRFGCCCGEDKIRIHFLNRLGTFDAINLDTVKIAHNNTSSEYKRSLPKNLTKSSTGIERFNVRSNKSYEVRTGCYTAENDDWCMELQDSPKAFLEWNGGQGQPADFLPIKIEDAKFERDPQSHQYTLVVVFKMANEKINLRN